MGAELTEIAGHGGSGRRRLAWLVSDSHNEVDAEGFFNDLGRKAKDHIETGFDCWVDGRPNDKRHHGWSKSDHGGKYTKCHVFKYVHGKVRLYGFKVPVRVRSDKRETNVELCILVLGAKKAGDKTDPAVLERVRRVSEMADVKLAVAAYARKELQGEVGDEL
jgi:hypothetical protein